MNKKNQIIYSAISLCALAAYCGFLIKSAISQVDVTEETLPYIQEEFIFHEATEPPLPVRSSVYTVPKEDDDSPVVPTEPQEDITQPLPVPEGFSPVFPVLGEVTKYFSQSHSYNESTRDWRSHCGIDITAPPAEPVYACEDGVVTSCYTDPLWGNVIEIDHGEYISVYKNLSTLIMVKEGDSVSRGEKISGVGSSAAAEAGSEHLHFEITHYNELVDPLELLG